MAYGDFTNEMVWHGSSGHPYTYHFHSIGASFIYSEPGNYIFARKTSPGNFRPIYIGETADLSERFDNHHKMQCIMSQGATHIHVHSSDSSVTVRQEEERDLVATWNPHCNG